MGVITTLFLLLILVLALIFLGYVLIKGELFDYIMGFLKQLILKIAKMLKMESIFNLVSDLFKGDV